MKSLKELPRKVSETAKKVGIEETEKKRSGSFFHLDESAVFSKVMEPYGEQIEILEIKEALAKYEWLKDHYWKLVGREKDEYTKSIDDASVGGYFIRIKKGQKIDYPIQSCMFISKKGLKQKVHNIIIAEEGSSAQIITGCATPEDTGEAVHIGVSEFYLKKNSSLTFSMIHNWGEETKVRPRTGALLEEGASFISNYVILEPVKDLQTYPMVRCRGGKSTARLSSIMYAQKDSCMDVGGGVVLEGKESRAEIISRAIAKDDATIISRGSLENTNSQVKGHLECRGLLLGEKAVIHAIPELYAKGEGADMSHEAAVGKIAEREILYLMTRRLTRDEAAALIIRGFLDTSILHLPEGLEKTIKEMTEKVAEGL